MDSVDQQLAHLHYDRRWLDYGVLDQELLARQAEEGWYRFDDPHTEYYRWETLRRYLGARSVLSDEEVERLVELCDIDPDLGLRTSLRLELLAVEGLTDAQFERVAGGEALLCVSKQVGRLRLARRLRRGEWSNAIIEEAISLSDAPVQRLLLEHPKCDRSVLELLKERGCNKAIRNVATEWLRSRRFRHK